ncbi:MAG TPA: NAD(P) transhydrogenase subunit alpha [Acidobacteriota bacterium]|nr:NAD(P) transhydrogenase subunit alpha [Acidobacteriota bacterium]
MDNFYLLLLVFAASGVISYGLISRVPPRLHTPLMSMTNAISAVVILGALLLFASPPAPWERAAGAVALAAASFNLVGGLVVTFRMLRFFK